MQPHEVRDALVSAAEQAAAWRQRMAERYPDHERNAASATALLKLAGRLRRLRPDHPRLWAVCDLYTPERIPDLVETQTSLLRRYGFNVPEDGDPVEFLQDHVADLEDILAGRGRTS